MQRLRISRTIATAMALAGLLGMVEPASAQSEQPSSQISVQGTGLFTLERDADGAVHDATNSGGFLVGYGYSFNDWAGVEGNYGYSRNTQNYFTEGFRADVRADIHQFTGAFIARAPLSTRVRPYGLAGGGAVLFDPTDEVSIIFPVRQARPAFLYGAGVELDFTRYIGVRGEYRGFVYETPDFDNPELDLERATHQAQPSVGVYFRF